MDLQELGDYDEDAAFAKFSEEDMRNETVWDEETGEWRVRTEEELEAASRDEMLPQSKVVDFDDDDQASDIYEDDEALAKYRNAAGEWNGLMDEAGELDEDDEGMDLDALEEFLTQNGLEALLTGGEGLNAEQDDDDDAVPDASKAIVDV